MKSFQDWLNLLETKKRPRYDASWLGVLEVAQSLDVVDVAEKTVVVAGTNGKGTTVRYIEQLLIDSRKIVGSTLSPHLHCYNERIRVNGEEVSDYELVCAFNEIQRASGRIELSWHDYATLAALVIFCQHGVERVVLEVGMGGRLDSANVVKRDLNVITNIGLEHTQFLGTDIESIGWEKVGIARPNIPLITGEKSLVRSIVNRTKVLNCPLHILGESFRFETEEDGAWSTSHKLGQEWKHYRFSKTPRNPEAASIAVLATDLLGEDLTQLQLNSLVDVPFPGRMELLHYQNRTWLLDVAHNKHAAQYLKKQIESILERKVTHILVGTLKDRNPIALVEEFVVPPHRVLLTETHGFRGSNWVENSSGITYSIEKDLQDAVEVMIGMTSSQDLVLALGSFDLVARLRKLLKSI